MRSRRSRDAANGFRMAQTANPAATDAAESKAGSGSASLVGVGGFEPPAPASQRQCSTRLSYTPMPMRVNSSTLASQAVERMRVRRPPMKAISARRRLKLFRYATHHAPYRSMIAARLSMSLTRVMLGRIPGQVWTIHSELPPVFLRVSRGIPSIRAAAPSYAFRTVRKRSLRGLAVSSSDHAAHSTVRLLGKS